MTRIAHTRQGHPVLIAVHGRCASQQVVAFCKTNRFDVLSEAMWALHLTPEDVVDQDLDLNAAYTQVKLGVRDTTSCWC